MPKSKDVDKMPPASKIPPSSVITKATPKVDAVVTAPKDDGMDGINAKKVSTIPAFGPHLTQAMFLKLMSIRHKDVG